MAASCSAWLCVLPAAASGRCRGARGGCCRSPHVALPGCKAMPCRCWRSAGPRLAGLAQPAGPRPQAAASAATRRSSRVQSRLLSASARACCHSVHALPRASAGARAGPCWLGGSRRVCPVRQCACCGEVCVLHVLRLAGAGAEARAGGRRRGNGKMVANSTVASGTACQVRRKKSMVQLWHGKNSYLSYHRGCATAAPTHSRPARRRRAASHAAGVGRAGEQRSTCARAALPCSTASGARLGARAAAHVLHARSPGRAAHSQYSSALASHATLPSSSCTAVASAVSAATTLPSSSSW